MHYTASTAHSGCNDTQIITSVFRWAKTHSTITVHMYRTIQPGSHAHAHIEQTLVNRTQTLASEFSRVCKHGTVRPARNLCTHISKAEGPPCQPGLHTGLTSMRTGTLCRALFWPQSQAVTWISYCCWRS